MHNLRNPSHSITTLGRIFAAFVCAAAPAFASVISAGNSAVSPGRTIAVPVSVSGISDLYAFQFDLSFDPSVLELFRITRGTFLPGSAIFVAGAVDNVAGTAALNSGTLVGRVPGASGEGDLVLFEFRGGPAGGTSALVLSNVILLDSGLAEIPFTAQTGSVRVANLPTPEPGTLTLLLSVGFPVLLLKRLMH